uniref:Uncharacterized protein n=1 Tax=Rhodopseudomonas palustris (strain BisA53) TaxID=316055 RepID=Q07U60_RHOP5
MNRYIVLSRHACAVFFDELADAPLKAIESGEAKINFQVFQFDQCPRDDIDALYDVYRAPHGFKEVVSDDYSVVTEQCEYVGAFKRSPEEGGRDDGHS